MIADIIEELKDKFFIIEDVRLKLEGKFIDETPPSWFFI